jgi:putative membrane protein insertion efficiency factor
MRRHLVVALTIVALVSVLYAQPLALAGIALYQRTMAPLASAVGLECRFTPSCSHYAEVVIERDGLVIGGLRTIRRIARCGPWTPAGTVDAP